MNDNGLMQRVQAGAHQRFDELVNRYRSVLLRVAESKLGDASRAEDVVQETFLAVFAARQSFNPDMSFRAWIWTILLNLCRRDIKRRAVSLPSVTSDSIDQTHTEHAGFAPGSTVLKEILVAEQNQQLHQWLQLLPETQADALRLRFFAGLKFQEIAQAMSCSLNGAKMRVKNGLVKLSAMAQQYQPLDSEGDIR
ncbi:MAG: hypothetical protein CMJ78_16515 [Planctomycetaceae bacterium]|nr:hypothetical protein [Planctomycetaceae bacterium]